MKILKEGIDWNDWLLKAECKNNGYTGCSAKLEVNVDDITYEVRMRYDDEWERYYDVDYYSFVCPCCKRKNYIDDDKIPFQVKLILKKQKERK